MPLYVAVLHCSSLTAVQQSAVIAIGFCSGAHGAKLVASLVHTELLAWHLYSTN